MILTTTDIKRPYKILGLVVSQGDDDVDGFESLAEEAERDYQETDAIIGVHMYYSPLVCGEQYRSYGTAIKFK